MHHAAAVTEIDGQHHPAARALAKTDTQPDGSEVRTEDRNTDVVRRPADPMVVRSRYPITP